MSIYFSDKDTGFLKERLKTITILILVAFSILILRLLFLQVFKSEHYTRLSKNNRIRLVKVTAPRGNILDKNNTLLAENRPSFNLVLVREDVQDMDKIKNFVIKKLNVKEEDFNNKLAKGKRLPSYYNILIKEELTWKETALVENSMHEYSGLNVEVNPKREFLYDNVFSHVIGYLGEINDYELEKKKSKGYRFGDTIGKYGLEQVFEEHLKGKHGGREVEVDAFGRHIKVMKEVATTPGQDITLTIDLKTQIEAYKALKGKSGAVVALNPNNGKVLVMASAPTFNPDFFTTGISETEWRKIIDNPRKTMLNKAIQTHYPPASTFKPITAIAVLEENLIDVEEKVFSGASFRLGRKTFRDWKASGHGKINIHSAIVQSSDTFFYQMGLKLGIDKLSYYAKIFGLGEKTDFVLKGEVPGLVPTKKWKKRKTGEEWMGGETVISAVGQGYFLSTPLQMATVYSAFANGGTLYTPQLIEKIETKDKVIIREFSPLVKSKVDISEGTMHFIQNALIDVVESDKGTARSLRWHKLKIAGKTGTAQVIAQKKRTKDIETMKYETRDHAWFVGYAPYDNPQIVVCVIIEHGGFGSKAAAPVALKVFKKYLKNLKIEEKKESLEIETEIEAEVKTEVKDDKTEVKAKDRDLENLTEDKEENNQT